MLRQPIHDQELPRRKFLVRAASTLTVGSLVGSTVLGCRQELNEPQAAAAKATVVPLRIAILGLADEVETIVRAWSAVSDHPLDMVQTALDRGKPIETESFLQSARRCDCVIYPMLLMGEALASNAVTDFSKEDLDSIREQSGDLLVSLKNSLLFAGRNFAVPLGARLPALMSTLNVATMTDWSQYDQWVRKELKGKAAEPTTAGWAGAMFLMRAASSAEGTWLFRRENLEPVIGEEPYVEALVQMKETVSHYQDGQMSPEAIWQGLVGGDLMAAIGFPTGPMIDGLSLSDLPNKQEQSRVLLDLFTPVASISAGCRQSVTAKKFIAWLCGAEGSENVRRQVPSMTITRSPRPAVDTALAEQDDDYDAWLRTRLETTMTLPVIQIDAAADYYSALDEQVLRCLDGQATPKDALRNTATRWSEITQEVGVENQMRQWRRCQGMRA